MTSNELIKALEADGWVLVRIKGSHHHFSKVGVPYIITISHPTKDLSIGQIADAKRKSGLVF